MKVLVINGSPRGALSNTLQLTNAVVEGLKQSGVSNDDVKQLTVKDLKIAPCLGCMSCWKPEQEHRCVIRDDCDAVLEAVREADLIIESFPLYFFGIPGPMKTLTDRMLPLMEAYDGSDHHGFDEAFHETYEDMSGKRLVVIATCGYADSGEIFDALKKEYNYICGAGNYTGLFCPEGEMFGVKQLAPQINAYLERYREIGRCLGKGEQVSDELIAKAGEPIIPKRAFEMIVKQHWKR